MSEGHETHSEGAGTSSLVFVELKRHAPFTAFGALTGIAIMAAFVLCNVPRGPSAVLFEIMHPVHVILSAIVTTALYRRYRPSLVAAVVVGFVGSVGIGTLSDIILPYLGGLVVGAHMGHMHVAFIEEWWLVNPAALLGVGIGLWRPGTRLPHSGHVFVSTWASLFYLTAHGEAAWLPLLPVIFAVLFVAVWFPCCFSDIMFPLLIAGRRAAHNHEH